MKEDSVICKVRICETDPIALWMKKCNEEGYNISLMVRSILEYVFVNCKYPKIAKIAKVESTSNKKNATKTFRLLKDSLAYKKIMDSQATTSTQIRTILYKCIEVVAVKEEEWLMSESDVFLLNSMQINTETESKKPEENLLNRTIDENNKEKKTIENKKNENSMPQNPLLKICGTGKSFTKE